MTIPYDSKVPVNPDDSLDISQPQIENNFQTLYDAFFRNHISLDAASNAGNHTYIDLIQQESSPQTDLNELSIYTKEVEGQTDQVFMRFQNNGTEFQFTNYQLYFIDTSTFFTFLPGNIIVYLGKFTTLTNNILDLKPPVAKNIFGVSVCPLTRSSLAPKPLFSLVPSNNGLFRQVIFSPSQFVGSSTPPSYYIIMANF